MPKHFDWYGVVLSQADALHRYNCWYWDECPIDCWKLIRQHCWAELSKYGLSPRDLYMSVKPTNSLPFQTNHEVFSIDVTVHLFEGTDDFLVCAWIEIVKSPAIDVSPRALFIDQCIGRTFRTERKFFPWQLQPIPITLMGTAINSTYTVTNMHVRQ